MKLFKRNNKLKKRIQELELYFGLFYTVDQEGYAEYKRDQDNNWNVLSRIEYDIKSIKEKDNK